jgi:hypothetical protein
MIPGNPREIPLIEADSLMPHSLYSVAQEHAPAARS